MGPPTPPLSSQPHPNNSYASNTYSAQPSTSSHPYPPSHSTVHNSPPSTTPFLHPPLPPSIPPPHPHPPLLSTLQSNSNHTPSTFLSGSLAQGLHIPLGR